MASEGVGRQDERTAAGIRDRDSRRPLSTRGANRAAIVRARAPGRRTDGRAAPTARREARGPPTARTIRTSSLPGPSTPATAVRSAARRLRRRASTAAPSRPQASRRTLRGRWSRCTCRSGVRSSAPVRGLDGRVSAVSRKRSASMIVETRNPPIDRPMPSSSGSFAAPGISRMRSTTVRTRAGLIERHRQTQRHRRGARRVGTKGASLGPSESRGRDGGRK